MFLLEVRDVSTIQASFIKPHSILSIKFLLNKHHMSPGLITCLFPSLLSKHFPFLGPANAYKQGFSFPKQEATGPGLTKSSSVSSDAERQKKCFSKAGWCAAAGLASKIQEGKSLALQKDSCQSDAIPTVWHVMKYFNLIQSVLICKMKQRLCYV